MWNDCGQNQNIHAKALANRENKAYQFDQQRKSVKL